MNNKAERKMKRKLYLIVALVLTAVVTGVAYAYAYTTTSATVSVTAATGDIATVEEAVSQPDWDEVLETEQDTETLRPNGVGDETNISYQLGTGAHWELVDEETPDGDSTVVYTDSTGWQEDLYNTANHSEGKGAITNVEVYVVCRSTLDATQTNAYVHIKTNGTSYNGTAESTTTSYATYSTQWSINPQTSANWTWNEIDALQIGVGLRRPTPGGGYSGCTQVYAEVDYEYLPLTGDVPIGNLFEVTPHADYTGDLAVKVYLANTGNLTKAYQSLNMQLYLEGSVSANETPNYQLLTLENGVATFTLIDEGGISHTLSVTGGDYYLVSDNISAWEEGWTVIPELYCEATQR